MNKNIYGYVGIEAFDVVLYIARTISKLDYPVLVVDLSGTGAFEKAINHGMGLNSKNDIVYYRGINFIQRVPLIEELEPFEYGIVFIILGMNYMNFNKIVCNSITFTTNTFPHIIEQIRDLKIQVPYEGVNKNLLIRDIIVPDDIDRVKIALGAKGEFNKTNFLYFDLRDYENAVKCQQTQIINFTKISSIMERYIVEQVKDMLPEVKKSTIMNALKSARKGR